MNENNLLWVKVIKSCYGNDGGFSIAKPKNTKSGVWMGIIKLVWGLHNNGLISFDTMSKKVGNGANTSFCNDVWCGDIMFRARFHHLFAISRNRDVVVSELWNGSNWSFQWSCNINGGVLAT